MKIAIISLGCPKNQVDADVFCHALIKDGHTTVADPAEADIIIINTCCFINDAKEESINTNLEMAEYKKKKCKYLIVMGCLVQRYYDELVKLLPEVDLFIKIDEYDDLWEKINNLIKKNIVEETKTKTSHKITQIPKMPMFLQEQFMNRTITTGSNFAYLKIGEGCSNKCTYCAIPYIRGPFVSRKEEDIIEEAKQLAEKGITELIIIAQDTTKYGVDIYGKNRLADLIEKLSKIRKIKWIRFLYSYPEGITEELIEVVANNKKVAKYFDIPIQHISNSILKRMNRKTNKENIEKLIEKIRNKIPNVTLRTSLIVGFPGETKEDFEELLEFVEKTKFDKLGVFMYSKEDGTPAAKMPEQIHGNTKKSRYNKIMKKQQEISKEILKSKIGQTVEVLIEDISFDKKYYVGRTMQDVPDIDGLVYIKNDKQPDKEILNSFVKCEIIKVNDYDLIAKLS